MRPRCRSAENFKRNHNEEPWLSPRPEGHHVVTLGASIPNVAKVLEFVGSAFGGVVGERYDGPDGSVAHAEIHLGDSVVMLGEPMPGQEPTPAMLSFHVDDADAVDTTYRRALELGALSVAEPANQFYGYRSATVRDIGGNSWTICTIVEQLTQEEISQRMAAMGES